jgi:hypothetical protein
MLSMFNKILGTIAFIGGCILLLSPIQARRVDYFIFSLSFGIALTYFGLKMLNYL